MPASSPEMHEDSGEDDIPRDLILLLTPDDQIRERLQVEAFVEFMKSALSMVADHCTNSLSAPDDLLIACALLPGSRVVVQIQSSPVEAQSVHARGITARLRQLAVPSVQGGPVAFACRMRFGQTTAGRPFTFPFASFANRERPTPLDEILLEAGGVRLPPSSLWNKLRAFTRGRRQSALAESESVEVAAALARGTRLTVYASNGQVVVGGSREEDLTIVDDQTASDGFAIVKYANGASGAVDRLTLDYVRSRAPQPTQAAFDAMLARVGRVRVLEGGMASGRPLGSTVLLDLAVDRDLAELKQALAILDGPGGHCMCCGEPSLELLSRQGEPLAVLGVHHGQSVRWAVWKDDAELLDGRRLLDWLAQHGMPGPLDRFLEEQQREEQGRANWQRWLAAMPDCLKQLSPEVWRDVSATGDRTPVQQALAVAYPDEQGRILELFRWFGHGAGRWTGFPVYEQLAEQILLQFPVEELVTVLENARLTEEELEGAARFFAGVDLADCGSGKEVRLQPSLTYSNLAIFLPPRSGTPAPIPVALRERLLAHCQTSPDEDKRRRAESAFAR